MTFHVTCLNNDSVGMDRGMWGEHGISLLVETPTHQILLDTGTSWQILAHNLKKLNKNLSGVSHIVLSHGHYDHTGGLMGVLNQTKQPTVVADPLIFNRKFSRNPKTGEVHETGIPFSREQVENNASLMLTVEPVELAPGVMVTGRIPRQNVFEQVPTTMLVEVNGSLEKDPMMDDRSIVLDTEKGLVLLCGCCHAGIINTLSYVRSISQQKIHAVIGGIHLVGAKSERIESTLWELQNHFQPEEMYFNHCTGHTAIVALTNTFSEQVKPYVAGEELEF